MDRNMDVKKVFKKFIDDRIEYVSPTKNVDIKIGSLLKIIQQQQDTIELLEIRQKQIRNTFKCKKCGARITDEDTSLHKCNGCAAEKCL